MSKRRLPTPCGPLERPLYGGMGPAPGLAAFGCDAVGRVRPDLDITLALGTLFNVNRPSVLFDARQVAHSMGGPLSALFWAFAAVVAIVLLVRPQLGRGRDLTMNRVGAAIFLLAALAGVTAALLPIPMSWIASARFGAHGTRVVEGCVKDLDRVVHPNAHNNTDTYFEIAGEGFHFNSSPWLSGFHNEDDVISHHDRLKITLYRQEVLKIERLGAYCD